MDTIKITVRRSGLTVSTGTLAYVDVFDSENKDHISTRKHDLDNSSEAAIACLIPYPANPVTTGMSFDQYLLCQQFRKTL